MTKTIVSESNHNPETVLHVLLFRSQSNMASNVDVKQAAASLVQQMRELAGTALLGRQQQENACLVFAKLDGPAHVPDAPISAPREMR